MRVLLKGALVAAALFTAAPVFAQAYYDYDYDYGPGFTFVPGFGSPGYDYDYGYGYGYGPSYAPAPAAPLIQGRSVATAPSGDSVAYCQQRFRSYDPASGTYLGFDGMRHPCP